MTIAKLYRYKLSCDGLNCENSCVIESEIKYSLKNKFYVVPERHDLPVGWNIVSIEVSPYMSPLPKLVCKKCFKTENYSRY